MIEEAVFGSVTIDGEKFDYDVYILSDGTVRRRDIAIARHKYGTSHVIPKEEVEAIIDGVDYFVVGTGHSGVANLSGEAKQMLIERGITCFEQKTPEAIQKINEITKKRAALIHVTC